MKKTLTVTIPSYNVEQYLQQTLDSFIEDSIMEDIEVLIVDDGSKDHTAEIGHAYETRYPDTFRLISKENGGHGSTINTGIEVGTGKYFKVVDGDDWVHTEDFVKLVQQLKTCDADYVLTNYYEVDDGTKVQTEKTFTNFKDGQVYEFGQVVEYTSLPMHALVIRTNILKEHQIRLDEHCFYVDVEYTMFPVPYVHKIVYFDLYVYMYRLALVTQSVSMQGYQKHMQNHIDVILHLTDFANHCMEQGEEEVKTCYMITRIAQMINDQVSVFLSFGTKNKKIKAQFQEFDATMKEKNTAIYQKAGTYSTTLWLLRKTKFRGYHIIGTLCRIKNG
ncbi:MAG: glycosyltransferase family A protein [Lachnospiraceae bacterium]